MASDHLVSQLEKGLGISPSIPSPANTGTNETLVGNVSVNLPSRFIIGPVLQHLKSIRLPWIQKQDSELQIHGRMAQPKVRRLQDYPKGFPKLACFLDSDNAFMVYRRFGSVFSRLLLRKQDEIRRMETTLEALDKTDAKGNGEYLMSHKLDEDRESFPKSWRNDTRTQLMDNLEKKVIDYADLLLKNQQLKALKQPSARDYRSVLHFMENDGGQLFEEESSFIYEKEDLITIRHGIEHAWLDTIIERILQIFRCRIITFIFCSKETQKKTDDSDIHYYDRNRISNCVTMIIMSMILVLLIVPIWLLYRFSIRGTMATSPEPIGIVLVFTLVFSIVLSAFTQAKRQEILAASAGYCAVLVVFLGNVTKLGK